MTGRHKGFSREKKKKQQKTRDTTRRNKKIYSYASILQKKFSEN